MNDIPQRGTLLSQTRRRLLDYLVEEGLGPGDKLPSKRDFALKYKVSELTVLNALNTLVDAGLLETRPSRGTYVLSPPRRPLLVDAYFPAYWRETLLANDTAHHSYEIYRQYLDGLVLSSSEQDVALTVDYVAQANAAASARQTLSRDGAVFFIFGDEELFAKLQERGVPYASVTTGASRWDNEVGLVHDRGIDAAFERLLAEGCRRFGLIDFPPTQGRELEKTRSARQKMRSCGFELNPGHLYTSGPFVSDQDAVENAKTYLAKLENPPDAFISGSSYQLRMFLRAAEGLGMDLRGVRFLSLDSKLAPGEPGYRIMFSAPQYFKQSCEAMKALAESVRDGSCSFPGMDIDAVLC